MSGCVCLSVCLYVCLSQILVPDFVPNLGPRFVYEALQLLLDSGLLLGHWSTIDMLRSPSSEVKAIFNPGFQPIPYRNLGFKSLSQVDGLSFPAIL